MKSNVVFCLILKDWRLQRRLIILSIVAGMIALAVLLTGGSTGVVIGAVSFFIAMVFCASLLPITNIVNERKKQTLPFLMSLPISSSRYGAAKLLSTFGMFLVPWLILVAAALYMIAGRHVLPNGAIPVMLILANLPFIGFCLIAGTALVAETEGWGNAAVAAVNSFLLARLVPARQPGPFHHPRLGQPGGGVECSSSENSCRRVRDNLDDFGTGAVSAVSEARLYLASSEPPVDCQAQFFKSADGAHVTVVTHVGTEELKFRKVDERNQNTLTIITAIFDEKGQMLAGLQRVLEMRLKDATLERVNKTVLNLKLSFDLQPGTFLVRTVVRDSEGALMGAATRGVAIR